MQRRIIKTFAIGTLAVAMMAASCFEVTDPLTLTVNTDDITYTSNVQAGVTNFGNPPQCTTINASEYLDTEFNVTGARIYDLTVQTSGAFAGNINNAVVTVNGTNLITFNGPWSSFSTPQSMLTSSLLVRNSAGISALASAITNKQPVTLCSTGGFSQAAPAGLSVTVNLKGQVDVQPN